MPISIKYSPNTLVFGGLLPGQRYTRNVTIGSTPSDSNVTASIINDASGGLFKINNLTVFDVERGPNGRIVNITQVGKVDGSGPLSVEQEQLLKIAVEFSTPARPLSNSFSAALRIKADGWNTVQVPIFAGIGRIETLLLQNSITLQQGEEKALPVLVTSIAGPDTFASYVVAQTPTSEGISLDQAVILVPAGGTQVPGNLLFKAAQNAPAGNHIVSIFEYAFGGQQSDLLDQTVTVVVTQKPVHPIDNFIVRYVEKSTRRICQLTGGGDPEGLTHLNDTTRFDLLGTDLGVSFDHVVNGERRTYFFFGDTNTEGGDSSGDSIAYTLDNSPDPNGVHLRFIMGDNQWRRLVIPGVSLQGFEVPTGGFSHAGKLFVFATTDHFQEKGKDYMGRSVLASAQDAHDNFEYHYDVSSCRTTCHFINVSPWKVNNDDWPGLPDNAWSGHQGVLMMGSGRYRESYPYLAYVPLVNPDYPSKRAWRYFRGLDSMNQPVWSDQEYQAAPLFFEEVFGELSFAWNPYLRRWLLLYEAMARIWMRSAKWPWGPWTDSQMLFDTGEGLGRFINQGGGVYAPYIISRYNGWHSSSQQAYIYYTMSTWRPYQVMLMKSTLQLVSS